MFTPTNSQLDCLPSAWSRHEDREGWMNARSAGIGASEVAAVLGIDQFTTALELYFRKAGLTDDGDIGSLGEWGLRMQPAIAGAVADRLNVELYDFDKILLADDVVLATLDYAIAHYNDDDIEGFIPVEVKKVTHWQADRWKEGPPAQYVAQLQQQIALTGATGGYLARLIGDDDFEVIWIKRDKAAIDSQREAIGAFWSRVVLGQPPLPDFEHATTLDLLKDLPGDEDQVTVLDYEDLMIVDSWTSAKEWVRHYDKLAKEDEARILHSLGEATLAMLPDGRKLTRKQAVDGNWRLNLQRARNGRRNNRT